jgi:hypothetical protein
MRAFEIQFVERQPQGLALGLRGVARVPGKTG